MSREGLSEAAKEADSDKIAQRPASNLLLAGTGLSLALAISAVVGLSNDDTVPPPVAAGESPAHPAVVSLASRAPGLPVESPRDPWYLTPSVPASWAMDPLGMAPLPMDVISDGQLTIDQMPAAPDETPPAIAKTASSRSRLVAPRAAKALPPSVNSNSQLGLDDAGAPTSATFQANAGDSSTSAFGEGRDSSDAPDGTSSSGASAPAHAGSPGGLAGGGSNEGDGDSHSGKPGGPGGDGPGDSDGPGGPGGGPGGGGPGGPGGGPGGPGGGPGGGGPGGHGGGKHGH